MPSLFKKVVGNEPCLKNKEGFGGTQLSLAAQKRIKPLRRGNLINMWVESQQNLLLEIKKIQVQVIMLRLVLPFH